MNYNDIITCINNLSNRQQNIIYLEQLADNFQTLIDAINKAKPAAVKGQYLKSVTLTSTMGPGVKINPAKL